MASGEYSERKRRELVAKWRASGLSQAEFCRSEGLFEWELSNWKRKETNREQSRKSKASGVAAGPCAKRAETEAIWRAHIFAQVKSGLRRSEYCKQHNLSINSFKRWRAKFVDELKAQSLSLHQPGANPFVEIPNRTAPSAATVEGGMLELILPGGTRIMVAQQTPMNLLVRVLKAIQE